MSEQKVQTKLIKDLEKRGYYVIKLVRTNKNGIPDILAIPPNSDVEFYEVKKPGKTASPLQEFRISELIKHGCKAEVFDGTN
jgi:Holliday junction resolvase